MADLELFGQAAWAKLSEIFHRAPVASSYRERLLILALAQGGGLHFENGTNGLKDIDIWAFFSAAPEKRFPPRARWTVDFGPSKFGKHPDDDGYAGRRIDILGRSIMVIAGEKPEDSVRRWLAGCSSSAVALRQKPLIVVHPTERIGLRL